MGSIARHYKYSVWMHERNLDAGFVEGLAAPRPGGGASAGAAFSLCCQTCLAAAKSSGTRIISNRILNVWHQDGGIFGHTGNKKF